MKKILILAGGYSKEKEISLKTAKSVFSELNKANFPHKKIKNYYFFQIGRWDLQLLDDLCKK